MRSSRRSLVGSRFDNLVNRFPGEAAAIDRYLEMLAAVGRAMMPFTLRKVLPPALSRAVWPILRRRLPAFMFRTTREVLGDLTRNQDLIAVLTDQWGDYGLPPRESAFLVHALVARH